MTKASVNSRTRNKPTGLTSILQPVNMPSHMRNKGTDTTESKPTTKLGRALIKKAGPFGLRSLAKKLGLPAMTFYHVALNGRQTTPSNFLTLLLELGEIDKKLYKRLLPWADATKKY